MPEFAIHRAVLEELEAALATVQEYYEAASVAARDSREEFAQLYFGDGAGVWLATRGEEVVGCIALRALPGIAGAGEVKRLYVKPAHRCRGIAVGLLNALESYAIGSGYEWLYLDTTGEMVAAVRFYKRSGYAPCGRYNNNPQATIFMRKLLKTRSAP